MILISLLIDPYVDLGQGFQDRIFEFYIQRLSARISPVLPDHPQFSNLGAFEYLTRVEGKSGFNPYVRATLKTLNFSLSQFVAAEFPKLTRIAGLALQKLQKGVS